MDTPKNNQPITQKDIYPTPNNLEEKPPQENAMEKYASLCLKQSRLARGMSIISVYLLLFAEGAMSTCVRTTGYCGQGLVWLFGLVASIVLAFLSLILALGNLWSCRRIKEDYIKTPIVRRNCYVAIFLSVVPLTLYFILLPYLPR